MRFLTVLLVGALALLASGEALAFGRCTDAGYLAGFDSRLGTASCRVIHNTEIRWDSGAAPLRIIVAETATPALDAAQAEFIAQVEELIGRIGPAMSAFGGLDLNETSILLSDLSFRRIHAATRGGGGSSECKIVFYKTNREMTLEGFLFTYAHEIFHCVQAASWAAVYQGEGPTNSPADDTNEVNWWMEGTAEYFAHLANPNSDQADTFINEFDEQSPSTSLVDMNYAASVFFLWLGGEREPHGVKSFIDHMASDMGRDAQLTALRARMPLDAWTEFGQDYLDNRIRQPGGRTIPSVIDQGETITFDRPGSYEAFAKEYALARDTMVFKEGRTYVLELEGASGAIRSRFSASAGAWTDPPERVLACDEDKYYKVLNTAIEGEDLTQQIVVTDSEEVDERACCLIGEWTPTDAARVEVSRLQNQIGGEMAAANGVQAPRCSLLGGGWTLDFSPGGTGAITWDSFTNECEITLPNGEMRTRSVMSGVLGFNWTILDRNVGSATYTENTVATAVTTFIGPRSTRPFVGPLAGPSSVNFIYQCSPTDLSVSGLYNLSPGAAHTKTGD